MQKKPIIIIAVLSVLALGLGYWVGLPKDGSDERVEVVAPPAPAVVTIVVTNTLKEVVTNIVAATPQPTPIPTPPTVTPATPQRPSGSAGRRDPYAALNLTDDQKKKVAAIQEAKITEMRKLFTEMRSSSASARREKLIAIYEKTNKQIEAILTDEQKKKFKELQSQSMAGEA